MLQPHALRPRAPAAGGEAPPAASRPNTANAAPTTSPALSTPLVAPAPSPSPPASSPAGPAVATRPRARTATAAAGRRAPPALRRSPPPHPLRTRATRRPAPAPGQEAGDGGRVRETDEEAGEERRGGHLPERGRAPSSALSGHPFPQGVSPRPAAGGPASLLPRLSERSR